MAERLRPIRNALLILAGLFTIIGLWESLVALFEVPIYLLPAPTQITVHLAQQVEPLWVAAQATLWEATSGFAIGSIAGYGLAVSIIFLKPLERVFMPIIIAISLVPSLAFVPFALIWFGLGPTSKIFLVAISVSFPIVLNGLHGLKQPEGDLVNLLRSFGSGPFGIMWRLRIPASLPSLVTGLRIGISRSMLVAVIAEMLGGIQGLGRVIYESTAQVDYLQAWAALVTASILSGALYGLLVWIDQKLVWWK